MGRGSVRRIDYVSLKAAVEDYLFKLDKSEVWLYDALPVIIERYVVLSRHKVSHRNQYPRKRFYVLVNNFIKKSDDWETKRKYRRNNVKTDKGIISNRLKQLKIIRINNTKNPFSRND
jgi:hypothetical protein